MKVGVFDSGKGGLSMANAISAALPDLEVVFRDDTANLPYGTKTDDELRALAIPHLRALEQMGCDSIVVACNTLSTTIVPDIKDTFSVPIVGVVPMVKPACEQTRSRIVAVCATPRTLMSPRHAQLKSLYGEGVTFLEPYCGDWASMIEANSIDQPKIAAIIRGVIDEGADVIVLGCTHYHWIEQDIKSIAKGRAVVIQPEQAVIAHLKKLIAKT